MRISNLISGIVNLYETDSPVNGRVEVVRDLFGTSIKCDGLTQSGDLIEKIWQKPLKKLKNSKLEIKNCLILGLGGGSTAKLVRKYWPDCQITGVDLDPIMIDLGRRYLKLDEYKVDMNIADAYQFVQSSKKKYDLVLVDVYQGRKVPESFDSARFAQLVKRILTDNGVAIFNRLYSGETRPKAVKFLKKLEKVFTSVDPIYPMANVMFICHSH